MLRSSNEMQWFCPLCCLGTIDSEKVAMLAIIWDMFLQFCWFIYNMVMRDVVTIAPLIVNFAYILFMLMVLWDIRDPKGNFAITQYYNYFRILLAILMSIFALSMFTLIFVFLANPTLEKKYLNLGWAIGFFLFFTPASVFQWGTAIGLQRALKIMNPMPISEFSSVSRYNPSTNLSARSDYGVMLITPRTQPSYK